MIGYNRKWYKAEVYFSLPSTTFQGTSEVLFDQLVNIGCYLPPPPPFHPLSADLPIFSQDQEMEFYWNMQKCVPDPVPIALR